MRGRQTLCSAIGYTVGAITLIVSLTGYKVASVSRVCLQDIVKRCTIASRI